MRQLRHLGLIVFLLAAHSAEARESGPAPGLVPTIAPPVGATDNYRLAEKGGPLASATTADTTWLHSATFDNGGLCSPQGWTSVDKTVAPGDFWHVDDYNGLPFGPLEGTRSLWCGARPDPVKFCTYLTLPGYANSWDQCWSTKNCLAVAGGPTANLDVSFAIRYDSEPSYDFTRLEYTWDCTGTVGWTPPYGDDPYQWSGAGQTTINNSYEVVGTTVKVRLRFTSDTSWSDQDGLYPSNGAVHIDSLKVESLPIEFFEDEAVGATSSNDWQSSNTPGFGDYALLMKGSGVLQEDQCVTNVSCLWAFIKNSTENYACGGHPEQSVVPHGNNIGQYISNEIWSPPIALTGTGSQLNLKFDVYRDRLSFNSSVVFYVWHVRTIVNGCPQAWKDYNFLYEGDDKAWYKHIENIGSLVDFTNGTHVQVALGVIDMCPFFCYYGSNACHSHAPLLDNVKVYRVNLTGPQWSVRPIDLFQDTFPSNGTITGKGRADEALDIKPSSSLTFTPGDSSVILSLKDGTYASGTGTNSSGLLDDPNISTFIGRNQTKKQVYMWVTVMPKGQPGKSGDALSEGPGGQANRYPHIAAKDYVDASGVTWTAIRADYTYLGTATNPGNGHPAPNAPAYVQNKFNVDLNDNLFTPGDTVLFFYGASSAGGTNYYSDQWHVTNNIAEVAANPMEFTILPAGGFNRGGNILYVDGADGYGDQPYFDGALMTLGLADKVDRFDVRGPASKVSNTLAGRVYNVSAQLNACYRLIMWDTGSLSLVIGDSDYPKTNDYALFGTFLGNLTQNGGLYLGGDDIAEELASPFAEIAESNFGSTYIPFNLVTANHTTAGLGVSPSVVRWPARAFSDDFVVYGGCPAINDFDVMNATGPSQIQMSYGAPQTANGAVISNQTNVAGVTKTVVLSGFSFANIRDDELDGIFDRARHLRDIIVFTGSGPVGPVTGAEPSLRNSLSQNYPNPFNPQTTIAFSLAQRTNVRLAIYDVNGALVRTLANETRAPGAYQLTWDGRNEKGAAVASGVYFYRLSAGSFTDTKKMVLLK